MALARAGGMDGKEKRGVAPENLEVSWDQPQPRYPAPERPLDQADERAQRSETKPAAKPKLNRSGTTRAP